MTIRNKLAIGVCVLGAVVGAPASAENRLALVVGNSAYQTVPALPNPANDARAMAGFLGRAGFDVSTTADLTHVDMQKAVSDFAAKIARAGSDTVALVYYAGHGVQIDGENFLVPVDARIQRESDVPLQAMRLADLMNTLSSVPSSKKIIMLDACRNNPFSEINRTAGRGLAIVDAPIGSIVSYSTSPGAEAEDGTGENSPYTTALLAVAAEPGLPIEQAFKRARLRVNNSTNGRQTPWESSSLSSDFSFFAGAPGAARPPGKPPAQAAGNQAAGAQAPVKTVEVWKRQLRAVTPQQAFDIVIMEDNLEAYEAYVSLYNTPPLAPRVRSLFGRRQEMVAWYIAVTVNNPFTLQTFLTKYPSSDLAATGMRMLERARNRSLLANMTPTPTPNATPTPACSCSTPPAPPSNRRASAPQPAPVIYQQPMYPPPRGGIIITGPRRYEPMPRGGGMQIDIGRGGSFGREGPKMNSPTGGMPH